MKVQEILKFTSFAIFTILLCSNTFGQGIETEYTIDVNMNSTAGTPHIRISEDQNASTVSTRFEMRNVFNATDYFELRSFLHPIADHRIGWYYNASPKVVWNEGLNGLGIGTDSPDEKLDVTGGIKLGNTTNTNDGTIRYTGSDFEGYSGGSWMSLTGGGGSLWSPMPDGVKFAKSGFAFAYLQSTDDNVSGYRFLDSGGSPIGAVFMSPLSDDLVLSNTGALDNNLVIDGPTSFVGINIDDPDARLHVASNSTGSLPSIMVEETQDDDFGRLFFRNAFNPADRWALSARSGTVQDHIFGMYYNGAARLFYNEDDSELVVEDNLKITDAGDDPDLEVEVTGNGTGEIKLVEPGLAFGGMIMSLDASANLGSISTTAGSSAGLTMNTGDSSPHFGFGTQPSSDHKVEIFLNSSSGSSPAAQLNLRENGNSDYSRLQFSQFGVNEYWHIAARSAPVASGNSNMNFYFWDDAGSSGTNILSLDGDDELVGINTGSPQYTLDVRHDTGIPNGTFMNGLQLENTAANGNNWQIYVNNSTGALVLYENENLRGTFNEVDGTYSSVSDKRLKKNINTLDNQLELIMKLRPTSYQFKTHDNITSYGFIAQEVEEIYPEFITETPNEPDSDTVKTIAYTNFIPAIVSGIQEQQEQINVLKKENEQLKAQLEKLMEAHQELIEKLDD